MQIKTAASIRRKAFCKLELTDLLCFNESAHAGAHGLLAHGNVVITKNKTKNNLIRLFTVPYSSPILGDPGAVSGSGEMARRTFWSTGGRAPWYRLSPEHFETVKRILAPDWAQKMLCIIVPNRQTASPEFFLWVRTYGYWLDHGLSGSCTKEMHAVRKLSVWYKLSISEYCLSENQRRFSEDTSLSLQQVFTLALIFVLGSSRCHDNWQPGKRRNKSEFTFFQSLLWLFQLAYFVKCKQTLLELNFWRERKFCHSLLVYVLRKTWN